MEASQPTAELHELLGLITEIRNAALDGTGNDDLSNAALALIRLRADRLETVVRALEETTLFDMTTVLNAVRHSIRP